MVTIKLENLLSMFRHKKRVGLGSLHKLSVIVNKSLADRKTLCYNKTKQKEQNSY